MKRILFKPVLWLLFLFLAMTGCYTTKKSMSELGGLMLLDNTHLSRNNAYYSKHNRKVKKNIPGNHKKIKKKNYRARHFK